ncbi:probable folate-biopterin transporter 2 isoform X1 [Phalaenopsis equestris]|uniref:probable folate-biopterin transporter 2 isoform X1 n=1 Tax=Phalaenopsis equestris TaxID=78828 RepID=UPI0009E43F0A|nr:probable folate-biopterin transporter 2 isoform X1 [Phalaenopsis equestris]
MGSLLHPQTSSSEHTTEDEKEPIVFINGVLKENGFYGHEFVGVGDSKPQQVPYLLSPLSWFKVLSKETHWSFVFGVIVVYGISQGFAGGTWKVSIEYYWKDVQKVQPSAAQFYHGIISIPWIVKPLWGLLTDVLPMAGYRRKPYFIFAGSAGVAIADVTIDACVAQNSIAKPSLAADMQSLCGLTASIGALIGFSLSGILIHAMGSQGVIGLLSIPCLLTFLVGILIKEPHTTNFAYTEVHKRFLQVGKSMWSTLKCPQVWRPCLYTYITFALSLNIQEGMFYWYTNPKAGPAFSQENVGFIFSIGSIGSLLGVLLYQNLLKDFQFRGLLFWSQLLTGFVGMLDLILVLRLNLKLGIPDYFFVVLDECVSQLIGRLKWMPILVLSSKLCPSGIEGTFFALLMSIDNVGLLSSSWGGGLLLRLLKVTRTEFGNLWTAILIRNIMRLLPLSLLFLVPKTDQNSNLLPPEMLMKNGSTNSPKEADVELASLVNSS